MPGLVDEASRLQEDFSNVKENNDSKLAENVIVFAPGSDISKS